MRRTFPATALLTIGLSLAMHAPCFAQTGPALLLKPFEENQSVQLEAQALFEAKGHTDADESFTVQRYDSAGRARFDVAQEHGPTVGYALTDINIQSHDAALPPRLIDQSFGFGMGVGKIADWEIGAAVGVGYAGNNPYDDSDALYALGDLIASKKLDENSSLQLMLNYDGNRTIFPDIPLPLIAYNHRVSDQFRYTIGLPLSSLTWKPGPRLTIDLQYVALATFDLAASYEIVTGWSLIGGFHNRFNGFTIDKTPGNDRLFFQQRQVEAGVRWQPCQWFGLTVVGGFAFDQEFQTGFDIRDTDTVRQVSDEPYVRVAGSIGF